MSSTPPPAEVIGKLAKADRKDLDDALEAAAAGFAVWRKTSAFDRASVMRKAADILKSRVKKLHGADMERASRCSRP